MLPGGNGIGVVLEWTKRSRILTADSQELAAAPCHIPRRKTVLEYTIPNLFGTGNSVNIAMNLLKITSKTRQHDPPHKYSDWVTVQLSIFKMTMQLWSIN